MVEAAASDSTDTNLLDTQQQEEIPPIPQSLNPFRRKNKRNNGGSGTLKPSTDSSSSSQNEDGKVMVGGENEDDLTDDDSELGRENNSLFENEADGSIINDSDSASPRDTKLNMQRELSVIEIERIVEGREREKEQRIQATKIEEMPDEDDEDSGEPLVRRAD